MLRSALMLLAVPLAGMLAQTSPIHVTVVSTSPLTARFRPPLDSAHRPLLVSQGRVELNMSNDAGRPDTLQTIELRALDNTSTIHLEASQNGHVIASADGSYLAVRRAVDGIVIEARSQPPASGAQPKPTDTASASPTGESWIALSHATLEAHSIRLIGARLEASGDVRLHLDGGKTLLTPSLSQDLHTGVIVSDSVYSIRVDGREAQSGVGFTTDTNMTSWHCLKRCAGDPASFLRSR
jgi:hypothetical protein